MAKLEGGPEAPRIERDVLNKANFGLLPEPEFSWGSFGTSALLNGAFIAVILILSAASAKIIQKHNEQIVLLAPVPVSEPPKPPPPIIKPPPPVIKVEAPKIEIPKNVELPKPTPVIVKLNQPPMPNLPAAPPLKVTPPPAPKPVSMNASAASVVNHAAVSRPVSLGDPNALKADPNAKGRPTQVVALGLAGMPPGNTGEGKAGATKVSLGSGSPNSTAMNGRGAGAVTVVGLNNGVPGGTGNLKSTGKTAAVSLGVNNVAAPPTAQVQHGAMTNVTITYKPASVYTEEARSLHIEGSVDIEVIFLASGRVQVIGVRHGLGHGLDASAVQSAEGIRFKPAMQDGHPVDQHTVVHIIFQLS